MSGKKTIIVFLYNRLFDPLIQSNFWLYIKDYLDHPDNPYKFQLVTYENPEFPLTEEQIVLVNDWQAKGVTWTKLKWHPGMGLAPKFIDIFQGLVAVTWLRIKGYKHLVSLGSVAGTYAYLYSLVTGIRFFLYQYEPHSEYAIDNKMWAPDSLQYRISNYLERRSALRATIISSGTRFMRDRLKKEWHVNASFFHIPTVANGNKFKYSEDNRIQKRTELAIGDEQKVLFYPGKFGDLYYREETAYMFKWLKQEIPTLFFLIVTPHEDEEIIAMFTQAGVSPEDYCIAHSDYEDIHHYYAAADFAVIAVPPGPSKLFISNIKVGEYLFAGLPFLITEGVSEDYVYATEKNVGVVVKDFKEEYVRQAAPQIKVFMDMPEDQRRQHCYDVALDYRGFNKLNATFKDAISTLMG